MISVTGVTKNYVLQPVLLQKHSATVQWLSSTLLWKTELIFFQKLLDENAHSFISKTDKKKMERFQNLILNYKGEINGLRSKLRDHENLLASTLETKNEMNTQYYTEHNSIMNELEAFAQLFQELKRDFFLFIEKADRR